MTLNEGMQIDTSTTSASGGGGGRMIAIGGGLGGLLLVVVALLLGVDPGQVATQMPMNTSQDVAPGFDLNQCRTGADANKYVQCRVVATGNSVDAVWKQLMRGYTRPRVRLFSDQVNTGCGSATTSRICKGSSAVPSRVRRARVATACAPSCRPTAMPGCGRTTRRPSSRRAPECRIWNS